MSQLSNDIFRIKVVDFQNKKVPILMQNTNGPCPLLAISNVLLLQSKIQIHSDLAYMDFRQLIHLVGDYLVQFNPPHHNPEMQANQQQQIDDALSTLPKLGRGLDVNVRFQKVTDFEYTDELSVLDMLGINLFHGWLVDPQDVTTMGVIRDMSYNQLLCLLVDADSNHRAPAPQRQEDPASSQPKDVASDSKAAVVPDKNDEVLTSDARKSEDVFKKWRSLPSVVTWFSSYHSRPAATVVSSQPTPAQPSPEQEPSRNDAHLDDSAFLQKLRDAQAMFPSILLIDCCLLTFSKGRPDISSRDRVSAHILRYRATTCKRQRERALCVLSEQSFLHHVQEVWGIVLACD
eukprot:753386-Hanusia_phi.AAC.5